MLHVKGVVGPVKSPCNDGRHCELPLTKLASDRLIFDVTCQFGSSLTRAALSSSLERYRREQQTKTTDAQGASVNAYLLEEECESRNGTAPHDEDTVGKKRIRTNEGNSTATGEAKAKRRATNAEESGIRVTLTAEDVRQALAYHSLAWLLEEGDEPSHCST